MKSDNWIIKVFLFTFFITLIVSGSSNYIASNSNMIVLIIITILIIILGILFDMIGTSILTANEANFHKAVVRIPNDKYQSVMDYINRMAALYPDDPKYSTNNRPSLAAYINTLIDEDISHAE